MKYQAFLPTLSPWVGGWRVYGVGGCGDGGVGGWCVLVRGGWVGGWCGGVLRGGWVWDGGVVGWVGRLV